MKAHRLNIAEIMILEPNVFTDDRGLLFESFNQRAFEQATGLTATFVQDNHSQSRRGVLRGLHYQLPPTAQGKLVRVVAGSVFDVAVDIRRQSPTFGKWVGEMLSAENKKQMWIPTGFAHGFLALTDDVEILYKVTDFHSPSDARSIAWNDPLIGIKWPVQGAPILSTKDKEALPLREAETFP